MTEGHRARLIASLASLEDTIASIAAVARDGRSPTSGSKLTPLPAEEWEALSAILERARKRLTQAVEALAPSFLAERSTPESLSGTLFRLAILLRTLEEETVDELRPNRMTARYGPLSSDEQQAFRTLTEGLSADLREARALVERMRR